MAKSKEEIYQQGLIDLGKGSFSGSASMPSEIGQLALPGFFSNLFSLKSKGLKPDKEPTLLDPKDRYAYQLKKAFPEKDAKYKNPSKRNSGINACYDWNPGRQESIQRNKIFKTAGCKTRNCKENGESRAFKG